MAKIDGLTINEAQYKLPNGNDGTIAVFMYLGSAEPSKVLDYAVNEYVGNCGYHSFVDSNLDNPWMRVIITNINDMKQEKFDTEVHKLNC